MKTYSTDEETEVKGHYVIGLKSHIYEVQEDLESKTSLFLLPGSAIFIWNQGELKETGQ